MCIHTYFVPCAPDETHPLPIVEVTDRINVCGWSVRQTFLDVDISHSSKIKVKTL